MLRHSLASSILLSSSLALAQPAPAGHAAPKPQTPAAAPAPAKPLLTITIDTSEAPDLEAWAEKAKGICLDWYPKLNDAMKSDGFVPASEIKFVFRQKLSAPAMTGGGVISVNAPYVQGHKDDFGMMVHELTHVVQSYPGQKENVGWLVEGIADYTRFWLYEPQTPQNPINKEKASYRDAYRTTAAFLGYLTATHDKAIVNKLNAKLRAGQGESALFKEMLGKTVDELWQEFIDFGAPSSPKALAEAIKAHEHKAVEPKPTGSTNSKPK